MTIASCMGGVHQSIDRGALRSRGIRARPGNGPAAQQRFSIVDTLQRCKARIAAQSMRHAFARACVRLRA
jgi:hypothetical protein